MKWLGNSRYDVTTPVKSTADAKVFQQTRKRDVERIRAGLGKMVSVVAKGHPRTKLADLPQRIAKLLGSKSAAKYVCWTLETLSLEEQATLPPPSRGCKKPTHRLVYTIDDVAATADADYDGLSALLTTAPLASSCDTLFTQFKEQNFFWKRAIISTKRRWRCRRCF